MTESCGLKKHIPGEGYSHFSRRDWVDWGWVMAMARAKPRSWARLDIIVISYARNQSN